MAVYKLIKLKRDSSSNWALSNPILSLGEPGYETDSGKLKIGDGVSDWNSLDYVKVDLDDVVIDPDDLADVLNDVLVGGYGIEIIYSDPSDTIVIQATGLANESDLIALSGDVANLDSALIFRGVIDPTQPNSAPTNPAPENGDLWISNTSGTVDDSWVPLTGQPIAVDQFLLYETGTNGWVLGGSTVGIDLDDYLTKAEFELWKGRINQNSSAISSLQSLTQTHTSQIGANQTAISNLQVAVNTAQTGVNDLRDNVIPALDQKINAVSGQVVALSGHSDSVDANLQAQINALSGNGGSVPSGITDDIEYLSGLIDQNTVSGEINRQDIITLSGLIDGGLDFKGYIDPTVTGSAPVSQVNGDLWVSDSSGVIDNGWTCLGGEDVGVNQWMIYSDDDSCWQLGPATDIDLSAYALKTELNAVSGLVDQNASGIVTISGLIGSGVPSGLVEYSTGLAIRHGSTEVSVNEVSGNSVIDLTNWKIKDGHFIPNSNANFDLGNAEYKVRHLFLSDNSIYMGEGNLSATSGSTVLLWNGEPLAKVGDINSALTGLKLLELQDVTSDGPVEEYAVPVYDQGTTSYKVKRLSPLEVEDTSTPPLDGYPVGSLGNELTGMKGDIESNTILISGIAEDIVEIPDAVIFKGVTDPTVSGSAPAGPDNGDMWVSNNSGLIDGSWTGLSGEDVLENQFLLYSTGLNVWLKGGKIDVNDLSDQYLPLTGNLNPNDQKLDAVEFTSNIVTTSKSGLYPMTNGATPIGNLTYANMPFESTPYEGVAVQVYGPSEFNVDRPEYNDDWKRSVDFGTDSIQIGFQNQIEADAGYSWHIKVGPPSRNYPSGVNDLGQVFAPYRTRSRNPMGASPAFEAQLATARARGAFEFSAQHSTFLSNDDISTIYQIGFRSAPDNQIQFYKIFEKDPFATPTYIGFHSDPRQQSFPGPSGSSTKGFALHCDFMAGNEWGGMQDGGGGRVFGFFADMFYRGGANCAGFIERGSEFNQFEAPTVFGADTISQSPDAWTVENIYKPTAQIDIVQGDIRIRNSKLVQESTSGNPGEISWDMNGLLCYTSTSWKRAPLLRFTTTVTNPTPDSVALTVGGNAELTAEAGKVIINGELQTDVVTTKASNQNDPIVYFTSSDVRINTADKNTGARANTLVVENEHVTAYANINNSPATPANLRIAYPSTVGTTNDMGALQWQVWNNSSEKTHISLAEVGCDIIGGAGAGNEGALTFGVKTANVDGIAERLRITKDDLIAASGYIPLTDQSLVTKANILDTDINAPTTPNVTLRYDAPSSKWVDSGAGSVIVGSRPLSGWEAGTVGEALENGLAGATLPISSADDTVTLKSAAANSFTIETNSKSRYVVDSIHRFYQDDASVTNIALYGASGQPYNWVRFNGTDNPGFFGYRQADETFAILTNNGSDVAFNFSTDVTKTRIGVGCTPLLVGGGKGIHIHDDTGISEVHLSQGVGADGNGDGFAMQHAGSVNGTSFVNRANGGPMRFYTNQTERLRIRDDGNFAIGTNVAGATNVLLDGTTDQAFVTRFTSTNTGLYDGRIGTRIQNNSYGYSYIVEQVIDPQGQTYGFWAGNSGGSSPIILGSENADVLIRSTGPVADQFIKFDLPNILAPAGYVPPEDNSLVTKGNIQDGTVSAILPISSIDGTVKLDGASNVLSVSGAVSSDTGSSTPFRAISSTDSAYYKSTANANGASEYWAGAISTSTAKDYRIATGAAAADTALLINEKHGLDYVTGGAVPVTRLFSQDHDSVQAGSFLVDYHGRLYATSTKTTTNSVARNSAVSTYAKVETGNTRVGYSLRATYWGDTTVSPDYPFQSVSYLYGFYSNPVIRDIRVTSCFDFSAVGPQSINSSGTVSNICGFMVASNYGTQALPPSGQEKVLKYGVRSDLAEDIGSDGNHKVFNFFVNGTAPSRFVGNIELAGTSRLRSSSATSNELFFSGNATVHEGARIIMRPRPESIDPNVPSDGQYYLQFDQSRDPGSYAFRIYQYPSGQSTPLASAGLGATVMYTNNTTLGILGGSGINFNGDANSLHGFGYTTPMLKITPQGDLETYSTYAPATDNSLVDKKFMQVANLSDIEYPVGPSPVQNGQLLAFTDTSNKWVPSNAGTATLGNTPLGGWPAGSVGEAIANAGGGTATLPISSADTNLEISQVNTKSFGFNIQGSTAVEISQNNGSNAPTIKVGDSHAFGTPGVSVYTSGTAGGSQSHYRLVSPTGTDGTGQNYSYFGVTNPTFSSAGTVLTGGTAYVASQIDMVVGAGVDINDTTRAIKFNVGGWAVTNTEMKIESNKVMTRSAYNYWACGNDYNTDAAKFYLHYRGDSGKYQVGVGIPPSEAQQNSDFVVGNAVSGGSTVSTIQSRGFATIQYHQFRGDDGYFNITRQNQNGVISFASNEDSTGRGSENIMQFLPTTQAIRMNYNVGLNVAVGDTRLQVENPGLSGTQTSYGMIVGGNMGATSVITNASCRQDQTNAQGFYAYNSVSAGATLGTLYCYRADSATTMGGDLNSHVGYYAGQNIKHGSSSNIGFSSAVPSGESNYAFFSNTEGTQSYMRGNVGIGTNQSQPAYKLVVSAEDDDSYTLRVGNTAGGAGNIRGTTRIGIDAWGPTNVHSSVALMVNQHNTTSNWQGDLHIQMRQDQTDSAPVSKFVFTPEGNLGVNASGVSEATVAVDVNSDRIAIRDEYTPAALSSDTIGEIAWDEDYIWVRTTAGWKKSPLYAFDQTPSLTVRVTQAEYDGLTPDPDITYVIVG